MRRRVIRRLTWLQTMYNVQRSSFLEKHDEICQKINIQEPQRNRNGTANYVNLIRTSTVHLYFWYSFFGTLHEAENDIIPKYKI